ncbi:trypsin-like peptidase domain-containing protein [Streptacidiphilus sp. P02-A3a]|uniref:trypsin-like peptidase domain-containing protein n=1 Tax=Streptacidiphilus sp. P02-A3a TaxID=2704468 RepID=UPI00272D1811|nr:trypsin-like peptidase domain-containing protein [Streptacidiphilus sp. P02-A3a]QMU73143.1 trypsin-like serine protease [Streptacidiphilus sp. P02-A3a]
MTDTHPNPASAPEPGASRYETGDQSGNEARHSGYRTGGAWAAGTEATTPLPPVPGYQPSAHEPIDGTVLPGFAPPPAPAYGGAPQYQPAPIHPVQPAYPAAPGYPVPNGGDTGGWPATAEVAFGAEGGQGGDGGTGGEDVSPVEGGEPKKRRMRRPMALVAAVALISALAGGVAGGYISTTTQKSGNYSTSAVVTSDSKGTSNIAAIAAAVSPATVQITVDTSNSEDIGTGIVLTSTGQILTNYHVISSSVGDSSATIKITFSNGKTTSATVLGTDAGSDIAVIKAANVSGLATASLGNSAQVAIGDSVVAIGNPDGLTGTVTAGIVSALNRKVTVDVSEATTQSNGGFGFPSWSGENGFGSGSGSGSSGSSGSGSQTATYNAIQTDASLNPGNSGGPLLNSSGQVIGINASMYNSSSSSGQQSSGTQAGSVGLGFAIPINAVKAVLGQLQAGQSITS